MSQRRAFTIIELIVVIAIITALAAILLPAIKKAREQAHQTQCESNLRQLTVAYMMFAQENHDAFLSPDASNAQAGFPANNSDGQVILPLFKYAPATSVFHCPNDDRPGALSYSINEYVAGTWPTYLRHIMRSSEVTNGTRIFLFIEEQNLNPKSPNYSGGFSLTLYPSPIWLRHFPAILHGQGTCISFLDGHVDYYPWSDPRTPTLPILAKTVQFPSTPGNIDLAHLQALGGDPAAPYP